MKVTYSRACSRFSPHEKQCPNWESANSCRPPDAATLKYPQTFFDERKFSSCTVPELGLKPSSGFSEVIRAAITWPHGWGLWRGMSKSMSVIAHGDSPYNSRMSFMWLRGRPIAIWNTNFLLSTSSVSSKRYLKLNIFNCRTRQ